MSRPHPVLLALAADRPPESVPTRDDGLLASALDHAMQGLLWSWVRDREPAYSERARLAGTDLATRQRHHRLWSTLAEVRDRCAAIGVDVATIKGVTTEARWYRRPGERPSGDVDVLVAPDGVARAGEVLRVLDPGHPLVGDLGDLVRSGSVQAVTLDLGGVAVDVHFDLLKLGYPMRSPETVWEHTVSFVCPDGATVRVLAPEAALVHLLVHANKDSFPRLLGYADVARIAGHDLDWDLVVRLLAREGLEDVAACALARVQGTLGLARGPLVPRGWLRPRAWHVVWPERTTLLGSAGTSRSRRQEALPFLVRGRAIDATRSAVRIVLPARAAVAHRYADVPGSYLGRLARGRWRTTVERGRSLRARRALRPIASPSSVDGVAKAGLLRARLAGGPLWLDVAGTSMGWSIPDGARVRVVAADRPRSGQVWAFCAPEGAIVVHRARRVGRDGTVFQGDACVAADPPAAADRLVGRVIEVSVAGGTLRWGRWAGALQRVPRAAVARTVRVARGVRAGAGG